jgi:hypothetical protein
MQTTLHLLQLLRVAPTKNHWSLDQHYQAKKSKTAEQHTNTSTLTHQP